MLFAAGCPNLPVSTPEARVKQVGATRLETPLYAVFKGDSFTVPCPNPDGVDLLELAADSYMLNLPENRVYQALRKQTNTRYFVVKPNQWDTPAMYDLLQRFNWNGAEISRRKSDGAFVVFGGERVIKMIEDLRIPDLMGVRVEPLASKPESEPVGPLIPPGASGGKGDTVLLDARENNASLGMAFLFDREELVWWTEDGRIAIDSGFTNSPVRALNFSHEIGITSHLADPAAVPLKWQLYRPRVAVVDPPDMWTAIVLADHKVPITTIDRANVLITSVDTPQVRAFRGTVILLPKSKGETANYKKCQTNPICYGMPEEFAAIKGEGLDYLFKEEPLEKGRMIRFGIRPEYRGQTYATFKLLLNAILTGAMREIR